MYVYWLFPLFLLLFPHLGLFPVACTFSPNTSSATGFLDMSSGSHTIVTTFALIFSFLGKQARGVEMHGIAYATMGQKKYLYMGLFSLSNRQTGELSKSCGGLSVLLYIMHMYFGWIAWIYQLINARRAPRVLIAVAPLIPRLVFARSGLIML